MCKYCELNEKGRFKALAKNNPGGFATTLVDIGIYENTGKKPCSCIMTGKSR